MLCVVDYDEPFCSCKMAIKEITLPDELFEGLTRCHYRLYQRALDNYRQRFQPPIPTKNNLLGFRMQLLAAEAARKNSSNTTTR